MSLRAFMYASEFLRQQSEDHGVAQEPAQPDPSPADMRERNEQAMQMLQGMLGKTQGVPRMPRRARR